MPFDSRKAHDNAGVKSRHGSTRSSSQLKARTDFFSSIRTKRKYTLMKSTSALGLSKAKASAESHYSVEKRIDYPRNPATPGEDPSSPLFGQLTGS